MRNKTNAKQVSINDTILFTIELLDESPDGFSACVPELGIYTFGATEEQAMRRVHKHVAEKYQDLVSCPTQLNENEQEYLQHYRAIIVPALVEASLRRGTPNATRRWKNLFRMVSLAPQVSTSL